MPFLTVLWMVLAAVGGGLVVLRLTGLLSGLEQKERLIVSFVTGSGIIGWLAFFPGLFGVFGTPSFAVILSVLTSGLLLLRVPAKPGEPSTPSSAIEWALVIGIVAVAAMDLAEALAPAADADTMAYHFETPRRYLDAGMIYAIPRALDGVTQLLLHMTYAVAMGIGGKSAVQLWTMVSGWGLGAVFYVLARRHMNRTWALTGALCLMTTPAVIYSAGSGHVEVRAAAFALLAAYGAAVSTSRDTDEALRLGWLILAGLCAGFFAGTKITGLILSFAVCVSIISYEHRIRWIAIFAVAAGIAGIQWYVFNWSETGDPVYPMLWRYADLAPAFAWSEVAAADLKRLWASELPFPQTLLWSVIYPIRVVFSPPPGIEALRTGVGPAAILCLPFALVAVCNRPGAFKSPLIRTLIAAAVFYLIWFLFGPSQRIRHLLPIYPIVLLCGLAGVAAFVQHRRIAGRVVFTAFAALLALQLAGQAVFSKKFVDYLITDETRYTFLKDNVNGYEVVDWVNRHLSSTDRILVLNRNWLYLLDVPYYYANRTSQSLISLQPDTSDPHTFIREIEALGITHAVMPKSTFTNFHLDETGNFMQQLVQAGCAAQLIEINTTSVSSRTIPQMAAAEIPFLVFEIDTETCGLR